MLLYGPCHLWPSRVMKPTVIRTILVCGRSPRLSLFTALHSLQHSDYVKDVFRLLNDPATGKVGGQKRREILMFLRELFNMAKTLQVRVYNNSRRQNYVVMVYCMWHTRHILPCCGTSVGVCMPFNVYTVFDVALVPCVQSTAR